jgi:hypothetical protein
MTLNLTIITTKKEEQMKVSCSGGHEVFSKTVHAERAKHGVTILVKEGIKAERLELKTKLNAVAKAEQET